MDSQKVAFVCLHGSAKSLIAAEYFNRIAIERNLPLRATTSGPEPDREVPENVIAGLKSHGIDVRQYHPALIAAGQLSDTGLIVSFACDAGRRLAPSEPEERWDECPAVSADFDIAWTFITGRVEKLISRLSAQWRATDANNYYVVRANALEDNVVLYKTVNGVRSSLDIVGRKGGYGIDVPVPANTWHSLRIDFKAARFGVSFNDKQLFEVEDSTFTDAGTVGLWTKADSVTLFDEVTYGEKS